MKWRARAAPTRAKERANISFFIFIMFFAVFGVIVLTELLLLERPNVTGSVRARYNDELQSWESKTEMGGESAETPPPAQAPLDGVWQPVSGTRLCRPVRPGAREKGFTFSFSLTLNNCVRVGTTRSGGYYMVKLNLFDEARIIKIELHFRFRFYVYSAFMERRTVAAVRVVAATKTRAADPVFCRLWLPDNRTVTLKARVQSIRENWNLKYSAAYVLCLLSNSGVKPQETVGASVAVMASAAPNRLPTNLLVVQDTEPKSGIEETLHVCVKPFHFSYGREEWMVEWIELHRLLGVTHFYMYNNSVSEGTGCLLDYYRRQGLITLLPWKLPIVSKVEIRTEGQFAAFNDCLYRSMASTGWLLVLDTDEAVLPRRERTLPALLNALSATYKAPAKTPAAFLFRNAFFYVRWEDDPQAPVPLLTARKTRRWATPHALKNRSKYAVRPREAVELGNHFLWEHAPGGTSVGVPTDRALLHHYRVNCEYGGVQCLTVPSTVDRTAHRWSEELMQRVTVEKEALAKLCHA